MAFMQAPLFESHQMNYTLTMSDSLIRSTRLQVLAGTNTATKCELYAFLVVSAQLCLTIFTKDVEMHWLPSLVNGTCFILSH